ncbi:hypothetical protein QE564_21195 [Escherichia coli]|nr:hypothetical protein [Escherichia coli]
MSKASALLGLWYELAIHSAPQNNYAQARERIDADSSSETSSCRRMTGNDSEPPTVAAAAESADCAGCP